MGGLCSTRPDGQSRREGPTHSPLRESAAHRPRADAVGERGSGRGLAGTHAPGEAVSISSNVADRRAAEKFSSSAIGAAPATRTARARKRALPSVLSKGRSERKERARPDRW